MSLFHDDLAMFWMQRRIEMYVSPFENLFNLFVILIFLYIFMYFFLTKEEKLFFFLYIFF